MLHSLFNQSFENKFVFQEENDNIMFYSFPVHFAAEPSQPTPHRTELRTEQRHHSAANTKWVMRQLVYPAKLLTALIQ